MNILVCFDVFGDAELTGTAGGGESGVGDGSGLGADGGIGTATQTG